MPPVSRPSAPVVEKMYQFVLWLVPTVEKFPRTQKFLLGDRLQQAALDVLMLLVEASYVGAGSKTALLARANLGLEKMRFLFRLALDLKHLDLRRYEFAAKALDEVGRMVGGWRKATGGPAGGPAEAAAH
jgi:hypothetical protein